MVRCKHCGNLHQTWRACDIDDDKVAKYIAEFNATMAALTKGKRHDV